MAFFNFFFRNNFIFEYLLAFVPFFPLLKGRKMWYLRVLPFIAAVIVLSHFTFLRAAGAHFVLNCLWYVFVVAFMTVAVFVSFKGNVWYAIFISISAFVLQHVFYKLKRIKETLMVLCDIDYFWLSVLLYWVIIIALYTAFYFLFVRRLKKQRNFKVNNIKLLAVTVVVLIAVIIANLYFESFFMYLGMFYSWHAFVFCLFGIAVCALLCSNLYNNIYNSSNEEDLRVLGLLYEASRKQYETFKKTIDVLNVKYHDLKYSVKALESNNQWVRETSAALDIFGTVQGSGNMILDVILVEKRMQCEAAGIKLNTEVDGQLLNEMSIDEVDLYILLGNAIDNAVECLQKVEDENERRITVIIKRVGAMAKFQIENFTPEKVEIADGFPVTSKPDKENHGFGVKSIAHTVEKYNGVYSFTVEDNTFVLEMLLPIQ